MRGVPAPQFFALPSSFSISSIQDGSTSIPSQWISGGPRASTNGPITDMRVGDFGLLPSTVSGGTYDQKYYDYLNPNGSGVGPFVAFFGGCSSVGASCGAFAWHLGDVLSDRGWYIGASRRLKKKYPGGNSLRDNIYLWRCHF